MARSCSVCSHPDRAQIDAALIEGGSYRDIARQWRVSKDAVARHKPHIEMAVAKVQEARETEVMSDAAGLSARLTSLTETAQRLLRNAEGRGDGREALLALRELTRLVEVESRIAAQAEAAKAVQVNVERLNVLSLSEEDRTRLVARLLDSGAKWPIAALQRLIQDS